MKKANHIVKQTFRKLTQTAICLMYSQWQIQALADMSAAPPLWRHQNF